MNPFRRFARPLRALFFKRQMERDMAEEMRFHLEQRAADQAADGLAPDEARFAAERKFGNLASIQEQARATRGGGGLESFLKDLRLAFRQLARSPGFSLLAILTLGLGIGANTGMFSAFNSIVLKPTPYPDSAAIDRIFRATAQNPDGNFSAADFRDLRQGAAGYGDVAAYQLGEASLSEPGQPAELASACRVSANLLPLLGLPPALGRYFRPGEELAGNDRVAVLSQRTWLNRFGGRGDIVGRTVRIDGEPHEIIGVLPPEFNEWRHLGNVDFFRPLGLTAERSADRHSLFLRMLGRRGPGVTRGAADAFLAGLGARLAAAFPAENEGASWRAVPLNTLVSGKNGPEMFSMLLGLSGFVLLIACSNLANFLLARTMTRAREYAVRAALGASRLQLLRPLAAEALLLALGGGVLALFVAAWACDWLSLRSTGDNGERVHILLDGRVFAWALGMSLLTALAFGFAPALFALRLDLNNTLKSGGRGLTGSRGHHRFRQALIVGQFALAMILLTGAALFIRGLDELNRRRSGWSSEHLASGSVLLPAAAYANPAKVAAFQRLALQRLEALPGVASAGLAGAMPYFTWGDARKYFVEGQPLPEAGKEPSALFDSVTPGYFDTVGTRILAGRGFTAGDTAESPRVFVLSQSLARALFGAANPIGRHFAPAGATPQWGEIVGVANDVVSTVSDARDAAFQVYWPMTQEPRLRFELAVRTTGAPSSVLDGIRATMAAIDPDLPIRNLKSADDAIFRANYQQAVLRDMLTSFAVLGLGLASLGIYGVIARTVAQRTGEFAIRLALGASVRDITRLVLGAGVRQALLGSAFGLLGAVAICRLLASSFPGMRLDSLPVLIGTTLLLIAVALVACWLPARRAGRVDAMSALRAE
ncbi:MAG: ABC transporter permease [Lacunisphaera sp.]